MRAHSERGHNSLDRASSVVLSERVRGFGVLSCCSCCCCCFCCCCCCCCCPSPSASPPISPVTPYRLTVSWFLLRLNLTSCLDEHMQQSVLSIMSIDCSFFTCSSQNLSRLRWIRAYDCLQWEVTPLLKNKQKPMALLFQHMYETCRWSLG